MNRSIHDTWLRVIGISLFSGLAILGDDTFRQPLTGRSLALLLLQIVAVALFWHLNRFLADYCRHRALAHWPTSTRLALTYLIGTLATTLLSWCLDALRYGIQHETLAGFVDSQDGAHLYFKDYAVHFNPFGLDFFHALFIALFYLTMYELLFYRQDSSRYQAELARSEQEREKLQVANLQNQLDVLKNQVNPHFLFNALNSLSALISEDPQQAEQFVDKLSGVYRYVLRANSEQHLTTLAAELQFIDAYYHLLQTRYGTGIRLTVLVNERQRSGQLPPLTLQLLVENAVKHNVVSPKRPLHIDIFIDEQGRLVVQNTLQPKVTRALSNGVGLTNIIAKYQMLNLPEPSIEDAGEAFTVRLPLFICSDRGD